MSNLKSVEQKLTASLDDIIKQKDTIPKPKKLSNSNNKKQKDRNTNSAGITGKKRTRTSSKEENRKTNFKKIKSPSQTGKPTSKSKLVKGKKISATSSRKVVKSKPKGPHSKPSNFKITKKTSKLSKQVNKSSVLFQKRKSGPQVQDKVFTISNQKSKEKKNSFQNNKLKLPTAADTIVAKKKPALPGILARITSGKKDQNQPKRLNFPGSKTRSFPKSKSQSSRTSFNVNKASKQSTSVLMKRRRT
mmetsp:Transcript_17535/g.20326  ORF Transcript_17535/g.20326 Transcript_17535/m.20326 type:complete len:247 (+) Transcript_17535:182-922(+)